VSNRENMIPLPLETRERFAALRDLLSRAQYGSAQICGRLGLETIYDFRTLREGRPAAEPSDALDVLVRLFMDAESVGRGVLHGLLPAADIKTLEAFGLLSADAADGGIYRSTALLYPSGSLYITSDRMPAPDELHRPTDLVYSAITESTRRFLAGLPLDSCESFLELCAGTGIAALRAARHAGHAWAADITARATHFAEFNGLLNDLDNFTAVRGDLFEAVDDLTFDRICAHPPYMPALAQECIYRDGGQDGEQITGRIVSGLPSYLRPGGRFYCYCLASDRQNAPLEQRLRDMLGSAAGEFDVLIVPLQEYGPAEYYSDLVASDAVAPVEAESHVAALQQLGVRQLIFSSIVLQRTGHARRVFTLRRQSGGAIVPREIDWLMRRESALLGRKSGAPAQARGENAWTLTESSPPPVTPSFEGEAVRQLENGGVVTDREVLTFSQLFGSDYVHFHRRAALENLAAAYSRELGLVTEQQATLQTAFRLREGLSSEESLTKWLGVRCLSPHELHAHLAEEALLRALRQYTGPAGGGIGIALETLVADYGVFRGIFENGHTASAWVREWLTPEEESRLEGRQKLARLAVRTFCTAREVPWHAPLIRRLKIGGAFRLALERVGAARQVQQIVEPSLPPGTIERLPGHVLLRRFRELWGVGGADPALTLLDRGFATRDEFTALARPYWLYQKVMGNSAAFNIFQVGGES
jgi:methylase of polypeptide subunit release factors